MTNKHPIIVVDRQTGEEFEEVILGEKYIRWAYQDSSSSLIEKALFRSPLISRLMGAYYDSGLSKGKIRPTIAELGIDESEFADPTDSYKSFNDFFIRPLKPEARPWQKASDTILSPADGRVLVFPKLEGDVFVPVKGHPFSVDRLLPSMAERYQNGALAIIRLCPADYHRYHFPCDGEIIKTRAIDGALHSVNPIALAAGPDIFGDNKREITLIKTENAGTLAYIEVGAFGVGAIVNKKRSGKVEMMEEKGYFKFGASTVVLVFEEGKITFSEDLIANSAMGKETLIKVGEELAKIG